MNTMPDLLVKDCMHRDLRTVRYGETVEKAVKEIIDHKVGSVLISKDDKIVGIVTEGDILNRVIGRNLKPTELFVQDIMSSPVETIGEDVSLEEAAKRMRDRSIKKLLVLKGNRPIGILSLSDLTKKAATIQKERFDGWARNIFEAWNAF
jgi:CBS domain-containing protein